MENQAKTDLSYWQEQGLEVQRPDLENGLLVVAWEVEQAEKAERAGQEVAPATFPRIFSFHLRPPLIARWMPSICRLPPSSY